MSRTSVFFAINSEEDALHAKVGTGLLMTFMQFLPNHFEDGFYFNTSHSVLFKDMAFLLNASVTTSNTPFGKFPARRICIFVEVVCHLCDFNIFYAFPFGF